MKKPTTVLSGMQPTGPLHIGNYLGALQNMVNLQNDPQYQAIFFIADYHSITENYDPTVKRQQIFDLACDYLAAGLDPDKSILLIQSQVPTCTELAWIFNTLTPMAELERMTQYKDKAENQSKNINVGLFDYPVLQAADILLYHSELVPVGRDQVQHLELTRDIARWFNNKYDTQYFAEVKPLLTPMAKVMSLMDPTKKMSKSAGDRHWIGINEDESSISEKIARALTNKDGVENLRDIYQSFETSMTGEFDPMNMAGTKKIIAKGIADYFAPFRAKRAELAANPDQVWAAFESGRVKAQEMAEKTIGEVREIVGLR